MAKKIERLFNNGWISKVHWDVMKEDAWACGGLYLKGNHCTKPSRCAEHPRWCHLCLKWKNEPKPSN